MLNVRPSSDCSSASSHLQVFYRLVFLKSFAEFTEKTVPEIDLKNSFCVEQFRGNVFVVWLLLVEIYDGLVTVQKKYADITIFDIININFRDFVTRPSKFADQNHYLPLNYS